MAYILSNTVIGLLSILAFYATGRALAVACRIKTEDAPEKLALYPATGMVLYSLAFTFLGFCSLYYKTTAYIALAAGLACIFVKPREFIEETRGIFDALRNSLSLKDPLRLFVTAAATGFTLLFFARSLAPDIGWDVLTYHLTLPKHYAVAHGIYYVPDIRASSFPQYMSMINVFGMLLNSPALVRMFSTACWSITIAVVYSAGRRLYSKRAGLFAALIFIVTPLVLGYAPRAFNDIWWALFFSLSCYFLLRWRQTEAPADFVFAGVLAGFALGSKILTLFLYPIFVLIIVATVSKRIKWFSWKTLAALAVFTIILASLSSPWFIRNVINTGDALGFISNDYAQVSEWRGETVGSGIIQKSLWFLTLPDFSFAESPVPKFFYSILTVTTTATTKLGCLGVGFAIYAGFITALFVKRKKPLTLTLIGIVAAYYVIWFFLMKSLTPRYFLPILPLASIIAGYGFSSWPAPSFRPVERVAGCVLILLLLPSIWFEKTFLYQSINEIRLALKPDDHYEYFLNTYYGGYDLPAVVAGLPSGSKVLSIDDRTYYLIGGSTPVLVAYPWNDFYFDYSEAATPEELRELMRARGFTHILSRRDRDRFLFPGSPWGGDPRYEQYSFRDDFLAVYGIPVGGDEGVYGQDSLYRLSKKPLHPPRPASERVGEGFDYPLTKTPEAFKTDG